MATVENNTEEPKRSISFVEQLLEEDLAEGKNGGRIQTRFPPEPNGYLHIGHAKAICMDFGVAEHYNGVCNLRFDDTNPSKENNEYVENILQDISWLGFKWGNIYYASDYFERLWDFALWMIRNGHAYVDEQTAEQIAEQKGTPTEPGTASPYRDRPVEESLRLFEQMNSPEAEEGSMVLRAKIDMASPNINLRDPAIYRIRRATHHNTGDAWCIYPMYTFAHPIEDALEQITHSIATLEFEDQRPFYDWLLERLCEGGLLKAPPPRQYEFARLNLTYVITSKRKLAQLVNEKKVSGWDDPRMPTIVGLRRRGYTPEAIQLFAERIGVTKSDSWIDYSTLDGCLREDLENKAHRGMAVLDPVKLVLTNWAEVFGSDGYTEDCTQPALPHSTIAEGQTPPPDRVFKIGKDVWIEREDFEEVPPKGYKRLFPGNVVRLKGGYVIECTGCAKDAEGKVTEVHAKVIPGTKSGTPGADSVKAKAAITWVGNADGVSAEVRLYDRLFTDPQPDAGGKNFLDALNPDSLKVVTAVVEPSLAAAKPDQKFQFERHGYFVADRADHGVGGKVVFNRVTGLKDRWN